MNALGVVTSVRRNPCKENQADVKFEFKRIFFSQTYSDVGPEGEEALVECVGVPLPNFKLAWICLRSSRSFCS